MFIILYKKIGRSPAKSGDLEALYLHPDNDRLLQIIQTPEDLHTGSWSLSFQSSSRREGDPIRTMMLA